jgi:hypothetical protein
MEKTTLQLKDLGLVKILKTDNSVAKSVANFDPQTGDRLDDTVTQIFPDQLKSEKETLQAKIDEIDALLADIDNTPITVKVDPVSL